MRRSSLSLPAVSLALLAGASPALAARPAEPGSTSGTTHVLVHYASTRTTLADAQALAADTEEAYGRLVTGAGGTPNAGLRAPVSDGALGGDGRVDVYAIDTSAGGGQVFADGSGEHLSAFVEMDPDLTRGQTRFRAAHELMHVLQYAYTSAIGLFSESSANWAAEWALPDVDPGDSSFSVPQLPLDCSYGNWEGVDCASGYRQWLFVERQVERFGPAFVDDWLMNVEALHILGGMNQTLDRQVLGDALQSASGATVTLRQAYADYTWRFWDPTAWTTTAVSAITARTGDPAATSQEVSRTAPDSGTRQSVVDHLGTRFIRVTSSGADPTGPSDLLRVSVAKPAAVDQVPIVLVADKDAGGRTRVPLTGNCGGSACATVSVDPATVRDAVLVLANDSETVDDATFAWRAELVPGTATPPSNDLRENALQTPLATAMTTDAIYAGGLGEQEAPCDPFGYTTGATRGVWFAFTAPNTGIYVFDSTATDYRAVAVVFDAATRLVCAYAPSKEIGVSVAATLAQGQSVGVYLGRHSTSRSAGRTARLTVTGPPAPPPPAAPADTTPTTPIVLSPPDTKAPVLRIASRSVRASRTGVLRFVLTCPADEARCRGTLSLPRTRKVVLGTRSFTMAGGKRATVQIKLSKKALRMLRKARRLTVRATIVVVDADANSRKTRLTLTLLAPR